MQFTLTNLSPVSYSINVSVPKSDVAKAFNEQLEIFKKLSPLVLKELPEQLAKAHLQKALQESDLILITIISFAFGQCQPEMDFDFSVTFEAKPIIKKINTSSLEFLPKPKVISKNFLQTTVDTMLSPFGKTEDTQKNHKIQLKNLVDLKYSCAVGSTPIEHMKDQTITVFLGGGKFNAEIEAKLLGCQVGQTIVVPVRMPNLYHTPALAGQLVSYTVQVLAVRKLVLPELTDALVVEKFSGIAGNPKTANELLAIINNLLKIKTQRDAFQLEKERVLKKMTELNPIELPPFLVETQKQALLNGEKKAANLLGKYTPPLKDSAEDKKITEQARFIIHSTLLTEAYAKLNNIRINAIEYDNYLHRISNETNLEIDQVKLAYKNPESRALLEFIILQDKMMMSFSPKETFIAVG